MKIKSTVARRVAAAALSLAAGAALIAGPASPASAETFNGTCEMGELCLWWLMSYNGPIADMYDSVPDYSGWHFSASNYWLDNNSESAESRSFWTNAFIYSDANYRGTRMFIYSQESSLGSMSNQASSHNFCLCT